MHIQREIACEDTAKEKEREGAGGHRPHVKDIVCVREAREGRKGRGERLHMARERNHSFAWKRLS